MRVIETLLRAESSFAFSLAHKYPFEFTYACGWLKLKTSLPTLQALLSENREDLEFLLIYAWTAGQLEAREGLVELHKVLESRIDRQSLSAAHVLAVRLRLETQLPHRRLENAHD